MNNNGTLERVLSSIFVCMVKGYITFRDTHPPGWGDSLMDNEDYYTTSKKWPILRRELVALFADKTY